MGEWEPNKGASDEWYTPPSIFTGPRDTGLRCTFDLDPCSPGPGHWVPAARIFTKADDGLAQDWGGAFVFMNPPYGGRNGHVPWVRKWLANANGIALLRAYTSAAWFHDYAIQADAMLFPRGKTKFVRPDGTIGDSPGSGSVFLAAGRRACEVLAASGLGLYIQLRELPCKSTQLTALKTTS